MPLVSTIPASINDLAQVLADSLQSGQGTRRQLGETAGAFAWTSGMPPSLADYTATTAVAGMGFDTVIAKPSGTPAGPVAAGGTKPLAVVFDNATVALVKHAGRAQFQLEQMLSADALASVVYNVLAAQVLSSFENAAYDVVAADAGETASGATLVEAVLNGQAEVLGNGGRPGLLIISPSDYASLMSGTIGGYGGPGANPAVGPVGTIFGMAIHVSAAATTGAPIVADSAAITCAQNEKSPMVIVDPFSSAHQNLIQLVVDLIAAAVVTSPAAVCVCSVTP